MTDKRYSLKTQIAEVERELAKRADVYPRQVDSRAMRQAEADMQIGILKSVLATLQWLQKNEAAIKAAQETNQALWAALAQIREAVEQHAAPGTVPAGEQLGPEPAREAEALVRAIDAIAAAKHNP